MSTPVSAPPSPPPGARYIVTAGFSTYEAEDIIEADAVGGFIEYTPAADCGWIAYVQDEDLNYQFRGSAWVGFAHAATDSAAGIQRNATQAEMEAGTSVVLSVTPGRQHHHLAHPKAWLYATVAGGTPTATNSYNIGGISDTNVGVLTITIDVHFSSANWASFAGVGAGGEGGGQTFTSKAAGSVVVANYDDDADAGTDPAAWSFLALGDQA